RPRSGSGAGMRAAARAGPLRDARILRHHRILTTAAGRSRPAGGNSMTRRTYNGPLVDVAGAVDLHCHPYPDLFPRLADDFDIVRAAPDAGMRGILPQCHHGDTGSRPYLGPRGD